VRTRAVPPRRTRHQSGIRFRPAIRPGASGPVQAQRQAVKRYADTDQQSMNSWIKGLLDVEDMRRRCAAHDRWMATHLG